MAGTRIAPVVNGTPTYKQVSVSWIDNAGDIRTDSYTFVTAVTDAKIETFVNALQAGSNASVFKVEVQMVYNAVADKSFADNTQSASVQDNIVLGAKNPAKQSQRAFIPSPDFALTMEADSEQPDPLKAAVTDAADAYTDLLNDDGTFWRVNSLRYSERREINQKVVI